MFGLMLDEQGQFVTTKGSYFGTPLLEKGPLPFESVNKHPICEVALPQEKIDKFPGKQMGSLVVGSDGNVYNRTNNKKVGNLKLAGVDEGQGMVSNYTPVITPGWVMPKGGTGQAASAQGAVSAPMLQAQAHAQVYAQAQAEALALGSVSGMYISPYAYASLSPEEKKARKLEERNRQLQRELEVGRL